MLTIFKFHSAATARIYLALTKRYVTALPFTPITESLLPARGALPSHMFLRIIASASIKKVTESLLLIDMSRLSQQRAVRMATSPAAGPGPALVRQAGAGTGASCVSSVWISGCGFGLSHDGNTKSSCCSTAGHWHPQLPCSAVQHVSIWGSPFCHGTESILLLLAILGRLSATHMCSSFLWIIVSASIMYD